MSDRIKRLVLEVGPVWFYRIILIISQLLIIPYLIKTIGVGEYGLFVILGVFSNFLSILDFGLGSSLQNHFATCRNDEELTESKYLAFNLITLAVLFMVPGSIIASIYLLPFLHIPSFSVFGLSASFSTLILSLNCGIANILSSYSKILIGQGKISKAFVWQSVTLCIGTSSVFIVVSVLSFSGAAEVFLVRILLMNLISLLFLCRVTKLRYFKWSYVKKNIQIIKLGLKFATFGLISVTVMGLPYKFIASMLSPIEIIKFNILERFFGVGLQFALSPLSAMGPKMTVALINKSKKQFRIYFQDYMYFAFSVIIIFSVSVLIINAPIIHYLGAGKVDAIEPMITILYTILGATNVWIAFYSTALQSGGYFKNLIIFAPVHVIVLLSISYCLIGGIGLAGAICAMLISNILVPCLILPLSLMRILRA